MPNAPGRCLFSRSSCLLRHQQLRNEFSQDISQSEAFVFLLKIETG
jgi:hypothetical protein